MRILIVHNTLNDSTSLSGVLRHYCWMANEWTAAGHQTDFVVAKAGWPQLRKLSPQSRLISSDNIFDATGYLEKTWLYFPAYALRMASAHWLSLPQHYDVVYVSSQLIFEVYAGIVFARRQRAKLAVKIHHMLAAQSGRKGLFDKLFIWTERQSARWINQRADLVICSTGVVAQDYHSLEAQLGLPQKPIKQIGYGIDLAANSPKPGQAKVYDVVFLGRMHEHKGVFDLPAVWREIQRLRPGSRLLVIGEGPHRSRVEELFRASGLGASVTFTGGISEMMKNEYLGQCRVGISLSHEEGWGLSITEYLGAGLPVVAYELPVFKQVFEDNLILVKRGNAQQLAQHVVSLLNDGPRQLELGANCRRFVERYDYRRVAQVELCALEAMVSGKT